MDGVYHRAVSRFYLEHLERVGSSGLYESLSSDGLLLPYEIGDRLATEDFPRVLVPEQLSFVSHPAEWPFSQLKDAALATLEIQARAMKHGLTLKDATPYNMQLRRGRMCLIDSLSFEKYVEGSAWKAYRQFCETFLVPLLWASHRGAEVLPLQASLFEGIPLQLASRLLPRSSWLNSAALFHVHLHAKASGYSERKKMNEAGIGIPQKTSLALLQGLRSGVSSLKLRTKKTEWSDYYATCHYSAEAFAGKKDVVSAWLERIQPQTAWDFGANTGEFSRLLADRKARVLAADVDHLCVDQLYRSDCRGKESSLHPLRVNLVNPTPAVGWANGEKKSLFERGGRRDVLLALALVHHLCLGKNITLREVFDLFRRLGRWVIVEFVPPDDPQSRRLLRTRGEFLGNYGEAKFLEELARSGRVEERKEVGATGRVLYLLRTHE